MERSHLRQPNTVAVGYGFLDATSFRRLTRWWRMTDVGISSDHAGMVMELKFGHPSDHIHTRKAAMRPVMRGWACQDSRSFVKAVEKDLISKNLDDELDITSFTKAVVDKAQEGGTAKRIKVNAQSSTLEKVF